MHKKMGLIILSNPLFLDDELKEIIFAKTIHYLEQLENRWPFTDRTIINRPYNQ